MENQLKIQYLNKPLNTTCEILHELLSKREVSMLTFSYMPGYRTRVSELVRKHGLSLNRNIRTGENKFGNVYSYAVYSLNPFHERNALTLYNNLNK